MFQIALFKGFPDIPHIPLPPEHSVGRNEATRSPTRENPESWQERRRPREIYHVQLRLVRPGGGGGYLLLTLFCSNACLPPPPPPPAYPAERRAGPWAAVPRICGMVDLALALVVHGHQLRPVAQHRGGVPVQLHLPGPGPPTALLVRPLRHDAAHQVVQQFAAPGVRVRLLLRRYRGRAGGASGGRRGHSPGLGLGRGLRRTLGGRGRDLGVGQHLNIGGG